MRVTTTDDAVETAKAEAGSSSWPSTWSKGRDLATLAFLAVVAIDVVAGVYYRFTTTSKMWLDEAQTVNIASLPIRMLPSALKRDGAPPLYYLVLHFWMGIAGHSDMSIRALSGIFSVLTLPAMWWVVRRWLGRTEALAALAVLASSPFAVYFATETRMYSLVMLLVTLGIGAVMALMERATVPRALAVAVLGALLLYTHYWALYLLFVVGCWFIAVAIRRHGTQRRSAIYGIGSLAVAAIAFAPWVPIFVYQSKYTGTPWALPPTLAAAYGWFAGFTSNQSVQQETISLHLEFGLLLFIVLLAFGIFAAPGGGDRLVWRFSTQPRARLAAYIAFGTLVVAWVASRVASTAIQPRYSSVVFPLLVVLIALGVTALPNRWLAVGFLAALSVCALWTVHWGAHVQRTQAGKVATALHTGVANGAIVVVCPDQLGPSLLRYAGESRYDFIGFPRFTAPELVDWVNYKDVVDATSVPGFAARVARLAGDRPFYLVWQKGYGFLDTCADLTNDLTSITGRHPTKLVVAKRLVYYQSMNLLEFAPTH